MAPQVSPPTVSMNTSLCNVKFIFNRHQKQKCFFRQNCLLRWPLPRWWCNLLTKLPSESGTENKCRAFCCIGSQLRRDSFFPTLLQFLWFNRFKISQWPRFWSTIHPVVVQQASQRSLEYTKTIICPQRYAYTTHVQCHYLQCKCLVVAGVITYSVSVSL